MEEEKTYVYSKPNLSTINEMARYKFHNTKIWN